MMNDAEPTRLRSLALAVYVPIVIFAIGEGAVIPFVVLGAQQLGASASVAGVVVAGQGVALLLFAVPSGRLVARIGGRRAATVAVAVTVAGLAGAALGTSVAIYACSVFVVGIGWSIWRLVRFDFLVGAVEAEKRGRALSVMGGSQRMGKFVGPLVAAAATSALGIDGAFFLHMVAAVVALAVFVSVPMTDVTRPIQSERKKLRGLAKQHRRSFRTAGVGLVILIIMRSARPVVLPLWAVQIGLDPAAVGVIFGVSSAVDAALFYLAGIIMDRHGRKWSAIPSSAILASAFLVLPFAATYASLMGVGMLMGLGNGIGSGYGATVGSDLAPEDARAEFLGIWQMVANIGNISGPVLLGGIVAVASLGTASVAIGMIGVLGAVQIAVFVPETLQRRAPPA